ncbi:SAM-dependent methyltransferase [bacterium]|nr:SAM-dependent methyltransferase [bacterium]
MAHQKFDVRKLERLNDPGRFETLPPDVMWEALERPDAGVLVEIGAGTALFAAAFVARATCATVYAADTEDVMLEWMRANRPEVTDGHIVPVKAEETRVPLENAIADVVYMINLHHELASPRTTYAEAYRLLAPGGRLLVSDWAPGESPHGPSQSVRVAPDTVARLLQEAGFADVVVHEAALRYNWLITGTKPTAGSA